MRLLSDSRQVMGQSKERDLGGTMFGCWKAKFLSYERIANQKKAQIFRETLMLDLRRNPKRFGTMMQLSVSEVRSSHRRCSVRKVCLRPATLLKKRLWHRCFPVNFAKFLRTPFLQNTSGGCFCKVRLNFS